MHELPEGLSHSLRSFRGSIYGNSVRNSVRNRTSDLEKGPEDFGEKVFDHESLSSSTASPSAMIVVSSRHISPYSDGTSANSTMKHPTHSYYALRQQAQEQDAVRSERRNPYPTPTQSRQEPRQLDQPRYDSVSQEPSQTQDHSNSRPKTPEIAPARRQATFDLPQTPASAKRSLFHGPKILDPDPAADRLDDETEPLSKEEFYELMGMQPYLGQNRMPKHLGTRGGLYATIHAKFEYYQFKYRTFDVLTYFFLALQIILSATFIILGSLNQVDSHIAIAVLGAVSTIIAGVLALMKGQGLPNRLRQVRDDLRNVLFEADELYWDVAANRAVLFKDIRKIREDYLRVMEEARRNHPDTWTRTTSELTKPIVSTSARKVVPGMLPARRVASV